MTREYVDRRGRSAQRGIESLHCFSSGPYYDPRRMGLGPIVGVDEHLVAAGAGFDWHAHRGVHIASWILEGTLRHEDSNGSERLVTPGALFVQSTGRDGIRHREWNASAEEPLRFIQVTVLGENEPGIASTSLPASVASVRIDVGPHFRPNRFPALALVLRGEFSVGSVVPIRTGAFFLFDEDDFMIYDNAGGALALVLEVDS